MASNRAAGILESKLVPNLNEPFETGDTSWIKPINHVGVWWEMITGKSS